MLQLKDINSRNNSSIAYTYVYVSSLNKCITFFQQQKNHTDPKTFERKCTTQSYFVGFLARH